MQFRLLLDGEAPGAWNMAADEAMAWAVAKGAAPPTLRFFRWQPPCLSLGFSQPYQVAAESFCHAHGVDIVRRPTGGRAVLHHLELTYSVAAPLGKKPFPAQLPACYVLICQALVAGLRRLGVPAELLGNGTALPSPKSAIPCFVTPAQGEVVVGGRKLVGSAMRRVGDAILQHGSLLEDWDSFLQAGALGLATDDTLRGAVVTLRDLLGQVPPPQVLHRALAAAFEAVLGVDLEPGSLTPGELEVAQLLARERYGHPRFTVHRDRFLPEAPAPWAREIREAAWS